MANVGLKKSPPVALLSAQQLDAWEPNRRIGEAGIKKAAALLGITLEEAKKLRDGEGKVTNKQVVPIPLPARLPPRRLRGCEVVGGATTCPGV